MRRKPVHSPAPFRTDVGQSRPRGFTLVEIIVVMGILTVLLALLMPVMGRARESARNAACLSNLRELGVGMSAYANENELYLPACWDGQYGVSWTDTLRPYIAKSGAQTGKLVIHTCPTSQFDPQQFPLSYGVNAGAFVYRAWDSSTGNWRPLKRITAFKRPVEVIAAADVAQSSGAGTTAGWISGSDLWFNNPNDYNKPLPLDGDSDQSLGMYGIRYRIWGN